MLESDRGSLLKCLLHPGPCYDNICPLSTSFQECVFTINRPKGNPSAHKAPCCFLVRELQYRPTSPCDVAQIRMVVVLSTCLRISLEGFMRLILPDMT